LPFNENNRIQITLCSTFGFTFSQTNIAHTHTRCGDSRKNFLVAENLFPDQVVANVRNIENTPSSCRVELNLPTTPNPKPEKSFLYRDERSENQAKADCEQMKKVPSRLRG